MKALIDINLLNESSLNRITELRDLIYNDVEVGLVTTENIGYLRAYLEILNIRTMFSIAESGSIVYNNRTGEIEIFNKDFSFRTKKNVLLKKIKGYAIYEPGRTASLTISPIKGSLDKLYESVEKINNNLNLSIDSRYGTLHITPKGVNLNNCINSFNDNILYFTIDKNSKVDNVNIVRSIEDVINYVKKHHNLKDSYQFKLAKVQN